MLSVACLNRLQMQTTATTSVALPRDPALSGTHTGGIWASLSLRDFRVYWASSMAQMGAMNVQQLVQPWLMYDLTGRASMLGYTALAGAIPMLAFSPIGGLLADKFHKRTIIQIGQALSCAVAVLIALAVIFHFISWQFLVITAFINGSLMAITMPSRQSMIREIVDRDQLTNALALNNAGQNMNRIMAPAVGGLLLGTVGAAGGYFTMAGLYVVALLMTARLPNFRARQSKGSWGYQMSSGLSYIKRDRTIFVVLVVSLGAVILSMPYMTMLPVFAKDVLALGPGHLGILMTVSGVGALATSLFLAALPDKNRGKLFLGSTLLMGSALVGLVYSGSYLFALLWIVPVGIGQAGRMAIGNILVQGYVEDEFRGRVMSIYMMEFGLTAVSTFGVAVIAEAVGVQRAVAATGVLLVAYTLFIYLAVPRMRKLD